MNSNVTYVKQFRDDLADNNNKNTKNMQLKNILDEIFLERNSQLTRQVLEAAINYITGQFSNVIKSDLSPKLLQSIEFIIANSNNYWLTNSQEITVGAVQIIFATCYDLVDQGSMEGLEIANYKPFTREDKIKLVNNVFDKLIIRNEFPNLLRNKNGCIKFDNEYYFDYISINNDGDFEILGNGYYYTQKNIKQNILFSKVKNECINESIIDDQEDGDKFSSFETISHTDIDIDNKLVLKSIKDETHRVISGRLTGIEINKIISSSLQQDHKLFEDTVFGTGKNKVVIKFNVAGRDEINKLLSTNELYLNTNSLTLIPYGITDRGIFHENHSVLVVVYKGKVTVVDPKSRSDSQITAIPCKVISTNWQGIFDRNNCGRYTAYLAISLATLFFEHDHENIDFNLFNAINSIVSPKLNELQLMYAQEINPKLDNYMVNIDEYKDLEYGTSYKMRKIKD